MKLEEFVQLFAEQFDDTPADSLLRKQITEHWKNGVL